MSFTERIQRFQKSITGKVDVVFLPISTDLQYLTGVPRDIPNYGAVMQVMGALSGAGFTKIGLLTEQEQKRGQ